MTDIPLAADNTPVPAQATLNDEVYRDLQRQINVHRQYADPSLLGAGIDWVQDKVRGEDDQERLRSLEELARFYRHYVGTGDQRAVAQIREEAQRQLQTDRVNVESRTQYSNHATGFLKAAGLFSRGFGGKAFTACTFGLDEARPSDTPLVMAADFTIGGIKGNLTRKAFHSVGSMEVGVAIKGAGLGLSTRLIDQGMSRRNYLDPGSGAVDILGGLNRVREQTLNKQLIVGDILVFAGAQTIFGTANLASGNALRRSPLLSTLGTGTTFGMSSGAYEEMSRQSRAGDPLDIGKVFKHSMIRGGLDTIAAFPGGLQARAMTRARDIPSSRPNGPEPISSQPTTELVNFEFASKKTTDMRTLTERAGQPTTAVEQLRQVQEGRENLAGQPIIEVPTEVNVYRPAGLPEIVIPRTYDTALNEVRELRRIVSQDVNWSSPEAVEQYRTARETLRRHPLKDRLLPEELIPHLEELPNSLTRRVIITDRPNPGDPDYRVQYDDPLFVSKAEATSAGDTFLFQPTRQLIDSGARSPLSEIIKHEYAHHLRWGKTKLSELYDRTTVVEPDSVTRSDGRGRPVEDWAINLGENLLHPDASVAAATARAIPVRSLILARALSETLGEIPVPTRGRHHNALMQRAQMVSTIAEPLARQSLNNLRTGPNRETGSKAAAILAELGL